MLIMFLSFVILLFLGVPIAYVLGISSLLYILFSGDMLLLESASHRVYSGIQNFGMLAIPLFIFVGEVMNSGGITKRLISFCQVILGHFRGGLAYVNVVANMFLASILGSANAQTAMMSRVMVPAMEKEGYKKEFSSALTVSSALLGPIIPPSLVFIIYGVTAEASIAKMFLGGIIPGFLIGGGLILLIAAISKKEKFPKADRASFKTVVKSFVNVIPALSIPAIILIGILSGVFTATESAAVAALIAMLIGWLLYKELKLKELPKILMNTALNTAIVTFIVAMASLFSWILTFERIPNQVADFLISISDSPFVFLLLINIIFLIVGMFLDGMAAMIILVPILLPVAVQFGIDPIQFGIILCVNLTIGLITPPVGTALFIASSMSNIKIERLSRTLIPFIGVALVALVIITYIPAVTLWIPSLFG
ncbi:TRAP transporter large permease [Niallia endozanthoxylica]|uniref:TRAP transporter large permease n=2 Tax=Niallia endozanthoxylica TaxID=2036016 RepID=A0A5J5HX90_9BACI|nr:TRAP transporter large permease [Niallia endozanthoxylica]